MTTVPASLIANVVPGVLGAGGNALDLNGLVLTASTRVPTGTVMSFSSPVEVADFFGPASIEAKIAGGGTNDNGVSIGAGYFGGYTNCTKLPATLLFTQYNANAVAAYLRGGDFSAANTIAQMQALSGSLTVAVDGYSHVISSINLSSYNSFSAAATGIQSAFSEPTEASFTASIGSAFTASGSGTALTVSAVAYGIISVGDTVTGTGIPASTTIISGPTNGGTGVYTTSQATTASTASCNGLSTVLDVSVCASPTIAVGQTLVGSGVTGTPLITAQISGTVGGIGLYRISGAQLTVVPPESMTGVATIPLVTYDSVSGAFVVTSGITGVPSTAAFATGTLAAPLLLTSATGAVLSQGAAAAVPATFMNAVVSKTQNWATFMTSFDPDGGSGNAVKKAFADWKNGQNNRYAYVCWDTDVTPTQTVPATGSLGYLLQADDDSGTVLIWEPSDYNYAAFVCGFAASLDFARTNGRTTLAFRGQAGLTPTVTDSTTFVNLGGNPQASGDFGNGYNFYAAVATANQNFINFQRGTITGDFQWADSYFNQIWMNSQFQLALMNLLQNTPSIPYNAAGNALIEAALADPIIAAGNYGAWRPGVALSAAQIAEVNNAAGVEIATTLQNQGWYLQIGVATAQVRQNRGTPPMTFWYVDGESVQAFNLASILVQ